MTDLGGSEPDVVIVGGGAAGCVLAARLSEDPQQRVLLLEAGPDYPRRQALPPEIASPLRPTYTHDWGYLCEPGRPGRAFKLPRGRLVGGSSATNAAIALRGTPADYDAWAARGIAGWAWSDVLPVFTRLERDLDFDTSWHGRSGPVPVRRYVGDELAPAAAAFLAACAALGLPAAPDLNAPGALGAGPLPVNVLDGVRQSAALTHLAAARGRANLAIRGGALVDRVLVEQGRACGVRLVAPAEELRARRVILAAGAYGSPAILLRSGIGPAVDLAALGIPVVADRPGVGAGLIDHPLLGLTYASTAVDGAPLAIFQAGLTLSSASGGDEQDLQVFVRAALPADPKVSPSGATLMLFVGLMQPRSRGRLRLSSPAAADAPMIDLGYFTHPADLPRMIEGVRLARRLARTPPLAALALGELYPGPAVGDAEEELQRAVLGRVETYHHPVGTCRMGPAGDRLTVVDARGAVYGVGGLAVVDASILPVIPAANTHLPTLMVAEKLATEMRREG